MYTIYYTKHAERDAKKIKQAGFENKVKKLINVIRSNPYNSYPNYEKLIGDFKGCYSRRINIQPRLIYEINDKERYVKILRMWTHYE